MRALTNWIARRFINNYKDTANAKVRAKYGLLEGWISILGNTCLFAFKLVIGLLINSLALIADAIHSLSDTATSIVVIIGFRISSKPPDAEHPYGHGRAEYIATLIISILLIVTGIEFIRSSVLRITNPVEVNAGILAILAVLLTIVIKEGMGQISKHLGRAIESDALEADFWHHRTDAISSGLVMIALIASQFGLPALDGFGGLGVAAILMYTGYRIAREAVDTLLGKPPTPELVQRIRGLAKQVNHVLDAHDVAVHSYGHHRYINLHIEVNEKEPAIVIHDVAEEVENLLRHELNAYALVHVDPITLDSEEIQKVRKTMDNIVEEKDPLLGFHELRIVNSHGNNTAIMDVMLKQDLSSAKINQFLDYLKNTLQSTFPDLEFKLQRTPIHRYK
jgi:cation diffusion facilitator family transporter